MLLAAACVIAAALAQARTPVMSVPREDEMAKLVAAYLPRMHLLHAPIDDRMAGAALQTFLEDLDYDRCYFLASDIEEFRRSATELDDQLQNGDVSFAYHVYDILKQRVADRVAFADKLLDKGFDFNVEESYEWKRKDADWPADKAAWDELWRKRVKNQLLARTVADQLAAEQGTNTTDDVSLNEDEGEESPPPAANPCRRAATPPRSSSTQPSPPPERRWTRGPSPSTAGSPRSRWSGARLPAGGR